MTFLCVTWVARSSSCLKRSMMAWLPGQIGPDDLQRHHAIQFAVAGFVDRAHPAFAEDLQDFVALAENRSRLQHGGIALDSWYPRRRGLSRSRCRHRSWSERRDPDASTMVGESEGLLPGISTIVGESEAGTPVTVAGNIDQGRRVRGRSSAGGRAVTLGRRAYCRATFARV